MKLLITGGAGFIGSAFVRLALKRWPEAAVVVLDKLTYAGNLANLTEVEDNPRYRFLHGDIVDASAVQEAMAGCTHVVNFAAETHVDRSILDAREFVRTNVEGTRILLETARNLDVEKYLQVSTDEVYGSLDLPHRSDEHARLRPRSPYSASKAGGDLLVQAYYITYGLPALISRGSNTYGRRQYPEKLVPLFITNAFEGLPLPVYGDGMQMRDWIHVDDHCTGIATVVEQGLPGEVYNIGVGAERPNLEVIKKIMAYAGGGKSALRHVPDRPGHDRRYALETQKLRSLGWEPLTDFDTGLQETVNWYRANFEWWLPLKAGNYQEYYRRQYDQRLQELPA